jgi:hypothetical protein
MQALSWAKARLQDSRIRENLKLDGKIGAKLAMHAGNVTAEEALTLEWHEILARYAKIPPQDVAYIAAERQKAGTPGLPKPKRVKGYSEMIMQELVKEHGLGMRMIRRCIRGG